MAVSTVISQKELERVAALAYEGETIKVMLCQVATSGYTAQSTVANWQTVELPSTGGYVRYSQAVGTGSYNATSGRYELPAIDAEFTASGVGFTYETIVIYIDGATYPHSVITESPNLALQAGQVQTYRISLITDD
jgi:phage baseplate assembly protein gpV